MSKQNSSLSTLSVHSTVAAPILSTVIAHAAAGAPHHAQPLPARPDGPPAGLAGAQEAMGLCGQGEGQRGMLRGVAVLGRPTACMTSKVLL